MRQLDRSEKCEPRSDLISGSIWEADLHISAVIKL